ncbi:hypothetical protein KKC00_01670, partial [Patescibacteria group bacterium]|nr:hypothetical protein [Patescibacteria group bacterium]
MKKYNFIFGSVVRSFKKFQSKSQAGGKKVEGGLRGRETFCPRAASVPPPPRASTRSRAEKFPFPFRRK